MKAKVSLVDGVCFDGESGSGHHVTIDGPPEHGGRDLGVRPMELMLLGLAACSAFDVVHILRRGRHEVAGCEVETDAQRAETEPKVFTAIHLRYTVRGAGLKESSVRRAVELSAEKYCSASVMLAKTARITHEVHVIEDA
jgi:putative redox protein